MISVYDIESLSCLGASDCPGAAWTTAPESEPAPSLGLQLVSECAASSARPRDFSGVIESQVLAGLVD